MSNALSVPKSRPVPRRTPAAPPPPFINILSELSMPRIGMLLVLALFLAKRKSAFGLGTRIAPSVAGFVPTASAVPKYPVLGLLAPAAPISLALSVAATKLPGVFIAQIPTPPIEKPMLSPDTRYRPVVVPDVKERLGAAAVPSPVLMLVPKYPVLGLFAPDAPMSCELSVPKIRLPALMFVLTSPVP